MLLTSNESAPLKQLVEEHVLLLNRLPSNEGLPLPSEVMISFAFDAQLEYLCFVKLVQTYQQEPSAWQAGLREQCVGEMNPFGPLVGGIAI